MKVYVVVKIVKNWPACGGGKYPDEVFLNYEKAKRHVLRRQYETDYSDRNRIFWHLEEWEVKEKN